MDFSIWDQCQTVSLEQLSSVALLHRKDTKYVLSRQRIPAIVDLLKDRFAVLKIDGLTSFDYRTIYYDTDDFRCYHDHHHDRSGRFKIRTRHYLDTGVVFDEIKRRTAKGKTEKIRQERMGEYEGRFDLSFSDLIRSHTAATPEQLQSVMEIRYRRTTLADFKNSTRITIDTDLAAFQDGRSITFPGLVIVEQKSVRPVRDSALRLYGVVPCRLSKYCLAVALLNDSVRTNRFRPRIRQVEKIIRSSIG